MVRRTDYGSTSPSLTTPDASHCHDLTCQTPRKLAAIALLLAGFVAPGCDSGNDPSTADPTGKANDEMLGILQSLVDLGARPSETLTPAEPLVVWLNG